MNSAPPSLHELESKLIESVVKKTEIVSLVSLPGIIDQALKASRPYDARRVTQWLALDPSLALRVLDATAGGAAVHGGHRNDSMEQRANALGPELIRAVLVSAAQGSVAPRRNPLSDRELSGFWSHSVRCAFLARALAEACSCANVEEAYLAGLLHDVGSLMLLTSVPDTYRSLAGEKAFADTEGLPEHAGRLGTIHAEVGAALLQELRLPSFFCDAVLLHHAPNVELEGTHPLVRVLRSAEALSRPPASAAKQDLVADLLGTSAASVSGAVEKAARQFDRVLQTLGLAQAAPPLPKRDEDAASVVGARVLTETVVGRVLGEADWLEAPGAPPSPHSPPPGGEGLGVTASILEQILEETVRLETALLVKDASDLPAGLAGVLPLVTAVAGLKRCVLFLPGGDDNVWPGWMIDSEGAERFEPGLSLGVTHSLVARAARDGMTSASYEVGRVRRLVGLDLEIARALGAEAVAAVPLKRDGRECRGVLVFGTSGARASHFDRKLPFLKELAASVAAALSRGDTRSPGEVRDDSAQALRDATRNLVHEARNPLSVLKAYLEIARKRVDAGEDFGKELEIASQEIDRVARLLERIGRPEEQLAPEPGRVNVNRIINELLLVYEAPLFGSKGISVELDLDDNMQQIAADSRMLKQVLLNLLKNASEAMSAGDRLRVSTADFVNYEGAIMVEISVKDSGPGMTPEKITTLFSPQPVSAAAPERGFGLANSLRLVKIMAGHLLCHSRAGAGTTFRILIPRNLEANPAASAPAPPVGD